MPVREDVVASSIHKIREYYLENGLGKSVRWVTAKVLKRILSQVVNIRTLYVIERSLDGNLPCIRAKVDVTSRSGCIENFEAFRTEFKPWSRFRKLIEERTRRGQISIVCFHKGKAVGYIWVTFLPETDRNIGITISPAEDETYGFDLYVLPEYRKQLVGFELVSHWLRYSRESGKSKAVGVVAANNQPMLMMTKLAFGFRKTKEVRSVEFFRYRGFVISEKDLS